MRCYSHIAHHHITHYITINNCLFTIRMAIEMLFLLLLLLLLFLFILCMAIQMNGITACHLVRLHLTVTNIQQRTHSKESGIVNFIHNLVITCNVNCNYHHRFDHRITEKYSCHTKTLSVKIEIKRRTPTTKWHFGRVICCTCPRHKHLSFLDQACKENFEKGNKNKSGKDGTT